MPRGNKENTHYEEHPMSRQEYISAMVHFYRGELGRADNWRLRLDTTTNWAVISTMGLLSFAFSRPQNSHASIVIGMFLLLHFLLLESRRYRFFDVWRNRVRMIEENFYAPILARYLYSPDHSWGELVADDLMRPRFKITYLQAVRARLRANYGFLFFVLALSWLAKLTIFPDVKEGTWFEHAMVGEVPWYVIFMVVICLYAFLFAVLVLVPKVKMPERHYWSSHNPLGQIQDF